MTDTSKHRTGGSGGLRLWPPPEGATLAVAATAIIYIGHWFVGAVAIEAAIPIAMLTGLALGCVLLHPGLREDLICRRDLTIPAILFGLTLLMGALMLTPWIPGGPHPIWTYVGESPAGTMDRTLTTAELIKLGGLGAIFLVGMASGASDRRARTALGLLLAAGVVFGLWAGVVWVTGAEGHSPGGRLRAHFWSANTAGTLFGVLAVLCLGFVLRRGGETPGERFTQATPPALAALLFAALLTMTASRGGIVATSGAVVVLLVLMMFTGRMKIGVAGLVAGAAAIGLLTLTLLAGDKVLGRFFQLAQDASERAFVINAHWQAFLSSPLSGYGLGTARVVNDTLTTTSNVEAMGSTRVIRNVYLTWLEGAGILGAVPMFLCVGAIMWRTLTGTLRRTRMTSVLFGLLAADMVFLLHGLTDYGLENYSMAVLFAWLLGLQFALAKGSRG